MEHLLASLIYHHDPLVTALIVLEAFIGGSIALATLSLSRGTAWRSSAGPIIGFAVILSATALVTFATAVKSNFPQVDLSAALVFSIGPLVIVSLTAVGGGAVHRIGRRSARNAMLSGSLLACGFSAMLFTAMTELVSPFRLAYDLTGVLVVYVLGAALFTFALWEHSHRERRRAWLFGVGLFATAIVCVAMGSTASILPFGGWMDAMDQADGLRFSPLAVLLPAEAVIGLVLSLFGSLVDRRAAARDQLETVRLRELADSTFEGILIHRDGIVVDGNRSVAHLLGTSIETLPGLSLAYFLPVFANAHKLASDRPAECDGKPAEMELRTTRGEWLPVEILTRPIVYQGQTATVSALRDIRERRAAEAKIRFLAHHDMLTELPNRALLKETLEDALHEARHHREKLAVCCLDLDGFKRVNDTQGHAGGDDLLCQVADRLKHTVGDAAFVARVGGDEFVVLLTADVALTSTCGVARQVIAALAERFIVQDQLVHIGTSVGIALFPYNGDDATVLLERADIALYQAKRSGRGRFAVFEHGMNRADETRRVMETELRQALDCDELSLVYQPVFDRGDHVVSFEALLRWQNPTFGTVPPDRFIPLAEDSGFIVELGDWVLSQACRAAMHWPSTCHIAINLSPIQLLHGRLLDQLETIFETTGLAPHRLELEITESVLMDNIEQALPVLESVRALGVRLVLDDFGTGYSSLSYLHRFTFQKLKIDRSFINRIDADVKSRAIVRSIISMAHELGLQVTAEGVESRRQLNMLRAQGCDEIQGNFLGQPVFVDAVVTFLTSESSVDAPTLGPIPGAPLYEPNSGRLTGITMPPPSNKTDASVAN